MAYSWRPNPFLKCKMELTGHFLTWHGCKQIRCLFKICIDIIHHLLHKLAWAALLVCYVSFLFVLFWKKPYFFCRCISWIINTGIWHWCPWLSHRNQTAAQPITEYISNKTYCKTTSVIGGYLLCNLLGYCKVPLKHNQKIPSHHCQCCCFSF